MINVDYLYNPEAAKPHFDKNFFLDKKLGFRVIENGTILPYRNVNDSGIVNWVGFGGIIDSEGAFIKESFIHLGTGGAYTPPPPDKIQKSSETVIYLGISYPLWGHCITDNIRRIWFLKSEYFKEFKDCPLVYISWSDKNIDKQKNFKRLLEILEVDVDRLQEIKQPTQFDKIILPDESFFRDTDRKFTNEYREAVDCVRNFALKNRTPVNSKKIYYLYGSYRLNHFGENRLAEYFHSKGYEIISPEKLTLDEQLNLLINCESFASTVGSCSHNSIFLRNGTKTIFIPRYFEFKIYQPTLDQVHPYDATYIDSSMSICCNHVHGPFCFIISPQLKRFFGDKWTGYEDEDFKNFLQYVKSSLINAKPFNPRADEYYGKILPDFMEQLKQREDLITAANMPEGWETFKPLPIEGLSYQTHVHVKGWGKWLKENEISNDISQKFDVQAVKINSSKHKVYYAVYYNDKEGWSEEVTNSEMAGTTGQKKSIYGIRIKLDEAGAKDFNILYRVHKFDGAWTDWAKNGECIYSHGQKLNAIQIKLESKT